MSEADHLATTTWVPRVTSDGKVMTKRPGPAYRNRVGEVWGVWEIVALNRVGKKDTKWDCRCRSCGNERTIEGGRLREPTPAFLIRKGRRIPYCVCEPHKRKQPKHKKNRIGEVHSDWLVIAETEATSTGRYWQCQCTKCGRQREFPNRRLEHMGKKSKCGCDRPRRYQHGKRVPLYQIWNGMIQRCTNPRAKAFADYGGRGIRVCERWMESFDSFADDVGERPPGTKGRKSIWSLDRKDPNGDYEPDNVRWATWDQQMKNCRLSRPRVEAILSAVARLIEEHPERMTAAASVAAVRDLLLGGKP